MFQTPALVMSFVLASIYAVAFHLWQGRRIRDLLFFWLASIVGFATGQLAGYLLNLVPWTIGEVHIVEATVIAVLFLAIARWLTQDRKTS